MSLHFQERGTKLCLYTFSSGRNKLCLHTFSRGGLNYASALSVEGD